MTKTVRAKYAKYSKCGIVLLGFGCKLFPRQIVHFCFALTSEPGVVGE